MQLSFVYNSIVLFIYYMHTAQTKPYLDAAAFEAVSPPQTPEFERESTDFINGVDKIQQITRSAFSSLLHEVKQQKDPFTALEKRLNNGSCILKLPSGASLQCKLSTAPWVSTTFAESEKDPGDFFRYIELFEYNPAKGGIISTKPRVKIRFSLDHSTGEWLRIYKGRKVSGQEAKFLAEELSYAMKIKKCFLADVAVVTLKKIGKIVLRVPLQVIRGSTFYSKFRPHHTGEKEIPSAVRIGKKGNFVTFKQDAESHQTGLMKLQSMKMAVIRDEILSKRPTIQKILTNLIERNDIGKQATLQELMATFYEKAKSSKQVSKDYLWACIYLLNAASIKGESELQQDYRKNLSALQRNMLFVANFT